MTKPTPKPSSSKRDRPSSFHTGDASADQTWKRSKPNQNGNSNKVHVQGTSKPSATGMYDVKEDILTGEKKGRPWTLSVALPSSIVANAQSQELRSYLVGQIARTLTIYGVDEVILYEDQDELPKVSTKKKDGDSGWNDVNSSWKDNSKDEGHGYWNDWGEWVDTSKKNQSKSSDETAAAGTDALNSDNYMKKKKKDKRYGDEDAAREAEEEAKKNELEEKKKTEELESEEKPLSQAISFFANNLQYLETPQYLRKLLFPLISDLKFAGLQNPIDAPHHLRKGEKIQYREGVVIDTNHWPKNMLPYGLNDVCADNDSEEKRTELLKQRGCFVCCGLDAPVWCEDFADAPIHSRVTVRLGREGQEETGPVEDSDWLFGELTSFAEPREKLGVYWGYQVRIAKSLQDVFEGEPFFNSAEEEGNEDDEEETEKTKEGGKDNLNVDQSEHDRLNQNVMGKNSKNGKKKNQTNNDNKKPRVPVIASDIQKNYDFVLGTSERGSEIHNTLRNHTGRGSKVNGRHYVSFNHGLVLFGGLGGLEDVMKNSLYIRREKELRKEKYGIIEPEGGEKEGEEAAAAVPKKILGGGIGVANGTEIKNNKLSPFYVCGNPRKLCQHYVNVCPNQSSRTVRSEEALMMTLQSLDQYLER